MQRLVKGIGGGIGLAAETIAAHKEKKNAEKGLTPGSSEQSQPRARSTSPLPKGEDHDDDDDDDEEELDEDEAQWALDDAAAELDRPPPYEAGELKDAPAEPVEDVVDSFLLKHRGTISTRPINPLPCPVILPQRRPKDKSRGFVRAYAPVLGECSDIDQKTFIEFLDSFDKASQASPVFHVINVAAMAVGLWPDPIAMAVSTAVQVAARTAQEVQGRYRTNKFLDRFNDQYFKPRGMYAMIMTFKPDRPSDRVLSTNMMTDGTGAALAKSLTPPSGTAAGLLEQTRKLRLTAGTTKGEFSLPAAAPLIYPAIDAAAARAAETGQPLPEKKQNALSSAGAFMSDYMDRRAQAEYADTYAHSALTAPLPAKKFASRFSDPSHPANSGTILGLLTGGHFDPKAKLRGRKAVRRAAAKGITLNEQDIRNAEMGRRQALGLRKQKLIGKIMHKDVNYLLICNLPTDEELQEIRRRVEAAKE